MPSVSALRLLLATAAAFGFVCAPWELRISRAAPAGDATAGKVVFGRCALCHSDSPGVNKIGPSLAGIVGSQSAAVPGFDFSPGMKTAKVTWDAGSLDKFLQNPGAFVHGTKMFFAVPDALDRQNVIAYLETLKN
jgi:cytochrome c